MLAVRLTLRCSLTNTHETIEFWHYKPLRAQKPCVTASPEVCSHSQALLGSVATGETKPR